MPLTPSLNPSPPFQLSPDVRPRLGCKAADACRATLGINVAAHVVTDAPLGVEIEMSPAGASWGTVREPEALLRAARRLKQAGCTAIAVVARFPDDEDEAMLAAYRKGGGVDCVGGAEAIISHLVTRELGLPCAHAPALPALELEPLLAPRACAEELGHTFLPRRFMVETPHPALLAVPRLGPWCLLRVRLAALGGLALP